MTRDHKPHRKEAADGPHHEGTDRTPDPVVQGGPRDEDRNPGIGSSKGSFATGQDPEEIAGDNTVEGDVGNDTTPTGGVRPGKLGRTNK